VISHVRRIGSLVAVALVLASAVAAGGYGRLLAQSKPLASDPTLGYLGNTVLPRNLHIFTLVVTGPPGKLGATGFIRCAPNPGIRINSYPITIRPYVRSYRTPPGSSGCLAGGNSDIAITNADGSLKVIPATIRLYGR
jgi:hypothetical protein